MQNIFKIFFVVELALLFFIALGIGLGDTLIWIFLTIIVGALCVWWAIRRGAVHILLAGVFLILPGYISDIFGILLILNVPLLRIMYNLGIISAVENMASHNTAFTQHFYRYREYETRRKHRQHSPHSMDNDDIIDGDFTRKDD